MTAPNLITAQQEIAYAEYLRDESTLSFWTYYAFWCAEQGLFNDQTSYQE